jgi:hypothetical protein
MRAGADVAWIENQFGSVGKVEEQPIVRVTNLITMEQSLFNPLRSLRPRNFSSVNLGDVPAVRQSADNFSDPLERTPANPFGRVEGKCCITAGNIASCEQYHCVIIFKNTAPLDFGCDEVADYIDTGWKWMQRAHEYDPLARYGLFLWNCNYRAGASISHGHAQAVLGRGSHYARIAYLRNAALDYNSRYGSGYFGDLYDVISPSSRICAGHDGLLTRSTPQVMILSDSLSAIEGGCLPRAGLFQGPVEGHIF